jgi:membrane protein implicated in regulation of membrane protease activity
MTWADVYLACFLVGFVLSLLSVLGTFHVHLPFLHFHGMPHVHGGHIHGGSHSGASYINFGTLAAFLAWFGGTGYLLTEYSAVWFFTALVFSVAIGVMGAALVFWMVAKLMAHEHPLDPEDYRMIGVLGRVSSRVRPTGTGEMIFSQEGTRRSTPVRSDDGSEIPKNTEVVVTRYEKGIAYVRRWEDLAGAGEDLSDKEKSTQA